MQDRTLCKTAPGRPSRWLLAAAIGVSLLAASAGAAWADDVTFWTFIKPGDGSPRGQALAQNLANFAKLHPDITVKTEVLAPSMIDPNLIQAAAAGKTPDVIRIYVHFLAKHVAAGSIQPLDAFVTPSEKADWLLPWNGTVIDGHKYALPLEYRFNTLLYRHDVLEKAGAAVPTTWDEMCKAAGKIDGPSVMGFGFGLSQADSGNALLEWAQNMVLAAGGQLFDDKGALKFDSPAGLKFLQTISDLEGKCHASGPAVTQFTYNSLIQGLASGTVAMSTLGTHVFKGIQAMGAGSNLGWSPPPSFDGKPPPVSVNGWVLAMGSGAAHPKAAWTLIQYLTSPAAQIIAARGGELPSRASAYQDPWFSEPAQATIVAWRDYMAAHGVTPLYPAGWFDFGQALARATQAMLIEHITPEQALAQTVQAYKQAVSQ